MCIRDRLERDTGTATLSRASGELTFEDVSFTYPGSETAALDRIDLRIPAGSLVAFVGRSGAGKTSLIQLLCRFYAPSAGRILLDGHPIGELRLSDYRRQLAVVFQSIVLFSDTVRANVAFGQVDQVDDAAILAALEVAQARDFVEALPEGLDTKLGDGGGGLGLYVTFGNHRYRTYNGLFGLGSIGHDNHFLQFIGWYKRYVDGIFGIGQHCLCLIAYIAVFQCGTLHHFDGVVSVKIG